MSLETVSQSSTQPSSTVVWDIDPVHTAVSFGVRHMMVSTVRGHFQKVSGKVTLDKKNPEKTKVEVDIELASVDTREPKRDEHLRSADFFDVANFPLMTFRSTKVVQKSGEDFEVVGDLTIHGVTRPVTLEVEGLTEEHADPWGFIRIGASAKTKIKRSDFGMVWNTALEAGGVIVGDQVSIQLEIELQRAK